MSSGGYAPEMRWSIQKQCTKSATVPVRYTFRNTVGLLLRQSRLIAAWIAAQAAILVLLRRSIRPHRRRRRASLKSSFLTHQVGRQTCRLGLEIDVSNEAHAIILG